MKRMHATILSLLAAALTVGCTVGEDYVAPRPESGPMATWDGRLDGAITAEDLDPEFLAQWWTSFEDATLTGLVERATKSNLDLRTASAQLRRARAERRLAQSGAAPRIGAAGSAGAAGGGGQSSALYSSGVDATWELDVFGRIERGVEAAAADLQATEENRRDVLVTVLAEVALNYADLRTLQERRAITAANIKSLEESLGILDAQLREGAVIALEVDRARANVAAVQSDLPRFDQAISEAMNRLAVLGGQNPGALDAVLADARQLPIPDVRVAVGVPAAVLRRRPDVRAAERRLAAETARVGVAIADLYPTFTLSGTIGLESPSLSTLFQTSARTFGIGPAVQWNVFDGGRTRQQIEVQSALQEQALVAYEQAILTALEDVQNAITGFAQEQLRLASLESAEQTSARAAEQAKVLYEAGRTGYLDLLDAQRSRLSAQDQLAACRGQVVINLVRLYKALGGGWDPEAPDTER